MARSLRDLHLSRNAALALVTLIGIAAIAILVYFLYIATHDEKPKQISQDQTSRTTPQPARSSVQQPDLPHGEEDEQYPTEDPQQIRTVTDTARNFTDAWLRTNRDKAAWLNEVQKYGTDDFNRQLALVELREIPAQKRGGEPQNIQTGDSYSTVKVSLDTGELTLRFNRIANKWLIARYSFDRALP